jgi:hypothetical protein
MRSFTLGSRQHGGIFKRFLSMAAVLGAWWTTSGCDTEPAPPPAKSTWQYVAAELPGAIFSVWGSGASDVWMVGARDPAKSADGPTVLRWNGKAWSRLKIAAPGIDLWWVAGTAKGDEVWMCGTGGTIARWIKATGAVELMPTPDKSQLFGVLPVSASEAWAVGGAPGGPGLVWRWDGKVWAAADVPSELIKQTTQWFKAFKHQDVLWIVGLDGKILRYDGKTWTSPASGTETGLRTIHCAGKLCAAVGGYASGEIIELHDGQWKKATPGKMLMLNGVFLQADGSGSAVGANGNIWRRSTAGVWSDTGAGDVTEAFEDYHGVWMDSAGGLWAVGGQLMSAPQINGQVVYYGPSAISKAMPK